MHRPPEGIVWPDPGRVADDARDSRESPGRLSAVSRAHILLEIEVRTLAKVRIYASKRERKHRCSEVEKNSF